MTADLLYGSLNFRSRLSFEESYLGSYHLGSPKPSSIFYIPFYDPLLKSLNLNPIYPVTLYSLLFVSGGFSGKIKVFGIGF